MLIFILSTLILNTTPDEPTEIIGSAATADGGRNEIIVEQPQDSLNPFGSYPQPQETLPSPAQKTSASPDTAADSPNPPAAAQTPKPDTTPLVNQSATVNPTDMNPLDYQNKIENTIYQDGDRLIDVQSIPLKDISSAVQPNTQPTITDYPAF